MGKFFSSHTHNLNGSYYLTNAFYKDSTLFINGEKQGI
jgi:hypothetical protein